MRYRLDLFSTTGPLTIHSSLFSPDIAIERWSHRIHAPGKLVFSIAATNPKATPERLRLYRRIRLSRDGVPIWTGYIEEKNELDGRIEVICDGCLGIFAKRYAANNQVLNGQASSDAFSLLSAANTDQDTGITEGTGGVTTTSNLILQGRTDVLKAWELKAQSVGAEFEIDTDFALNFVPSLGTDLTASSPLIFRRDGQPGMNLASVRIGESGRDMATRVIGISTAGAGLSYQYDAADQTTHGLIVEVKQFNEAQDLGTLTELTTTYGEQRNNPLPDLQIVPQSRARVVNPISGELESAGFDAGDFHVGDLRTVTILTENQSTTAAKRIAEVNVTVDEEGQETVALTLSEAGVFVTAGYLDAARTDDLARRIRQIEQAIS